LSGRGLCDELITRPEESYRLRCVVVCDLETSRMGAPHIYDISRLRVKVPSQYKSISFNCNHSQTATSTSSVSYKRRPPRCWFSVPIKLSVARCDACAKQCKSAQRMLTPLLLCQHVVWARLLIPETRKWLWLFVSCCECKNTTQIRVKMKKRTSMYTGITLKINASSLEKWLTFNLSVTSHLIFTSYESVHTIRVSHDSYCSIFNRTTPV